MADLGQMPPEARKRYEQNQKKEARRSLKLTLTEVQSLQRNIAANLDQHDGYQRELATRLERIIRDLGRLFNDE